MSAALVTSNILYFWRQTLGAVLALVLAGSLIYIQFGLAKSAWNALAGPMRYLTFDYVAYDTNFSSSKYSRLPRFPADKAAILMSSPDIREMQNMLSLFSRARIAKDGSSDSIQLLVLSDQNATISTPAGMSHTARRSLAAPGTIFLPQKISHQYNVGIGEQFSMSSVFDANGVVVPLTVTGLLKGKLNIDDFAIISEATAPFINNEMYRSFASDRTSAFLISLDEDGFSVGELMRLRRLLAEQEISISTRDEFFSLIRHKALNENEMVRGFIFASFIVTAISFVIIMMVQRSAIIAQREQFSSLTALGVKRVALLSIIIKQSAWLALFAAVVSLLSAIIISTVGKQYSFIMPIEPSSVVFVSAAILVISLLSGALSFYTVLKFKPVELLR